MIETIETIKITRKEALDFIENNLIDPIVPSWIYPYYKDLVDEMDSKGWDHIIIRMTSNIPL